MGSNGRSGLGTSQSQARISIYVDKAKKEISLLINGRLIKTWRELAGREFNGKGRGLMFVTRNSTPVRISGIQIAGWDGNLPKGNNVAAGDGKADFVEFINQDSLSGQVLSLKRGRLEIDAGFGDPVEVALERVGRIDLKGRGGSVPEMPVRAVFRDRGKLSFTLGEWAQGKVKLNSPVFGTVSVDEARLIEDIPDLPQDEDALRAHPAIGDRVRSLLLEQATEAGLPRHERPQKVLVITESLTEEAGTLTRGLKKVVPRAIAEKYMDQIEAAYAG